MKIGYVDSSCVVAVLLTEAASPRVGRTLGGFDRLYASNLLEAEVLSVAHREGLDADRAMLFGDLRWVSPSRALSAEIDRALAAGYLRGADLWHVANALYLRPDIPDLEFLSLDGPQAEVAARLGFRTPLRARA
jgi:hypothetical protein